MAAFLLSLLSGLWTRISGWAVLAGALVAALGIAWLRGRAAGKASWEAKRAQVRDKAQRQSGDTSEAGGVLCRSDRVLELVVPPAATAGLSPGTAVLDLVRTDLVPPRHLAFILEIPVVQPVTRGSG